MKNSGTSSLFFIISDGSCVNSLGSGNKDGSDLSIGLEVSESSTGKSSIDLELFYNWTDCDQLHFRNFVVESFELFLAEEDLVLNLVPGLSLRPLLLLSLTTGHGGGHLLFLRLLLDFRRLHVVEYINVISMINRENQTKVRRGLEVGTRNGLYTDDFDVPITSHNIPALQLL